MLNNHILRIKQIYFLKFIIKLFIRVFYFKLSFIIQIELPLGAFRYVVLVNLHLLEEEKFFFSDEKRNSSKTYGREKIKTYTKNCFICFCSRSNLHSWFLYWKNSLFSKTFLWSINDFFSDSQKLLSMLQSKFCTFDRKISFIWMIFIKNLSTEFTPTTRIRYDLDWLNFRILNFFHIWFTILFKHLGKACIFQIPLKWFCQLMLWNFKTYPLFFQIHFTFSCKMNKNNYQNENNDSDWSSTNSIEKRSAL